MDGTRFDDLTRLVGRGTTRRRVIAAALGMTAIAVDAGVAIAARPTCRAAGVGCTRSGQCCSGSCETSRQLPRRLRNRCACEPGLTSCHGACVDTDTDEANCGACDTTCDTVNGEICDDGGCCGALQATCATDADCCDTASVGCFLVWAGAGLEYLCRKRDGVACKDHDECYDGECDGGVCVDD